MSVLAAPGSFTPNDDILDGGKVIRGTDNPKISDISAGAINQLALPAGEFRVPDIGNRDSEERYYIQQSFRKDLPIAPIGYSCAPTWIECQYCLSEVHKECIPQQWSCASGRDPITLAEAKKCLLCTDEHEETCTEWYYKNPEYEHEQFGYHSYYY